MKDDNIDRLCERCENIQSDLSKACLEVINKEREKKGISLGMLSAETGLSVSVLKEYFEHGRRLPLWVLIRILVALNMDMTLKIRGKRNGTS